ncbi:ATP-dependent helicase [Paramixta manurensis]|uniref:ATP-dependent helicase n=1 Tax=Paramixta manurensis TaxID=2740817 RepID=A0A6M8UC28_9GAMM|nr:ATP-dependent helicase [Erwiniaceae bacterium PD-1]
MPTPHQPLHLFTTATQRWFASAFAGATAVQQQAWQAIDSGQHCLVIAPTGSGKTLAAFLHAIDALFTERAQQTDKHRKASATRILYISPVKALAADVQRNLRLPLEGVYVERKKLGEPEIEIRVGMRSGDTTPSERGKLLRRPPDILITTPESLFLMLTSKARTTLSGVTTVIIDEVHAVAGGKRGSHLALSLERLDRLLPQPAQRIGLSATVRPVERVANFLGGVQPTQVVNPPSERKLQLKVAVPVEDMTDLSGRFDQPDSKTASSTGSIWPSIEADILAQVLARRATIIFANSRGLAEKLTARLNERYAQQQNDTPGPATPQVHYLSSNGSTEKRSEGLPAELARSHHGSVSKEQRLQIESALKNGELRCVVATSSLELGIDMGLVDLVIQVGAPPSVASALQRVGRAGHQVGGISSGIVYPRTRRDLVDACVTVHSMRTGDLEAIEPPHNPLDILAQQTVAAVSIEPLQIEDWFATVRRSDPFRSLPRSVFDATLDMLSGKYPSDDFASFRPRLVWDRNSGMLTARPGAQHLAVTSGGTIPDRGLFSVMLPEGEEQSGSRRVGELDEEMVYESRVNDIITLGASSWRIQQITHDQVIVIPAPGRSARLPFWHGEGPGRAASLGETIGAFLRETEAALEDSLAREKQITQWQQDGLDRAAVNNLLTLVKEQRESTGLLPTDRTLLIERCRDESGDWRVILHSPYGQRVHAPWALAVAERIRRHMGLDPAVVSSDDGIVARFPDSERQVPGAELFLFEPEPLQQTVADAVGGSALFAARFRECAARALLLPRRNPGKRSPLWQQRLRAGQLLEVAREYQDFPILLETARECLQDVYDLPALHHLMSRIQRDEVQFAEVTTETPSPFAAPLLFGYVAEFMYASDAPLAERRASLLALDSKLLSDLVGQVDMAGLLDETVIERVGQELQRTAPNYRVSTIENVVDLLRELGPLSSEQIAARLDAEQPHLINELTTLENAQRIFQLNLSGEVRWAVIEDAARLRDALGIRLPKKVPDAFLVPVAHPLRDLVSRYARTHTPFSTLQLARHLGLGSHLVEQELERLREQGKVLHGDFGLPPTLVETDGEHPSPEGKQWVAEEVFRRLRVRSLQAARNATRPVAQTAYVTLLLERHGVLNETAHRDSPTIGAYQGVNGVARVIEQLAGVPLPASLWEAQILPARVRDYQPAMLDELLSSGEAIWTGHKASGHRDGLISLHLSEFAAETLPLRLDNPSAELSVLQQAILSQLASGGGWFIRQLYAQSNPQGEPGELTAALWDLVWDGYVTSDTWAAVRMLTSSTPQRARAARPLRTRRGRYSPTGYHRPASTVATGPGMHAMPGRWSLVPHDPADPAPRALAWVENMLDRYGVITRGAAVNEQVPGGFPALQPVLRSMEDAGKLLRGRFVDGLGAAQFADNLTIDRLRIVADKPAKQPAFVALAALDPANPFGTILNWPNSLAGNRPTRRHGAWVVIGQGSLLLYLAQGGKDLLSFKAMDETWLPEACRALGDALKREKHLSFTLETVDGQPVGSSALVYALREAGFSRVPKGYSWYG